MPTFQSIIRQAEPRYDPERMHTGREGGDWLEGLALLSLGPHSSTFPGDGLETSGDALHGYPGATTTALEEEEAGVFAKIRFRRLARAADYIHT